MERNNLVQPLSNPAKPLKTTDITEPIELLPQVNSLYCSRKVWISKLQDEQKDCFYSTFQELSRPLLGGVAFYIKDTSTKVQNLVFMH